MLSQKWHRDDRMAEIVLQQTDILSFITQGLPIAGDTHPWLMVLLDAVQEMAFRVAAEFKDAFPPCRARRICRLMWHLIIRTPAITAPFPVATRPKPLLRPAVLSAL